MFSWKAFRSKYKRDHFSLRIQALMLAGNILFIDWATKLFAPLFLSKTENVTVFKGFDLVLRHNTGAAFSFLADESGWQRWFFIGMAVMVSLVIIYWLGKLKKDQDKLEAMAFGCILGGALGNLWDRIDKGYVVDFILIYYDSFAWPAFNIADSAICIGVFLFIIDLFKKKPNVANIQN